MPRRLLVHLADLLNLFQKLLLEAEAARRRGFLFGHVVTSCQHSTVAIPRYQDESSTGSNRRRDLVERPICEVYADHDEEWVLTLRDGSDSYSDMTGRTHTKPIVSSLARALGADIGWTGALLERIGVRVKADGTFDARQFRTVLDKWAPKKGGVGKVDVAAREEMGDDAESCRRFLVRELQRLGAKVIHEEEQPNVRFTVDLPDGRRLWALTYVSLKPKSNPLQCGFTATPSRLHDAIDWYFFLARPLGRIFALSRADMHAIWKKRGNTGSVGRMPITLSAGNKKYFLENRAKEMFGVAARIAEEKK